MAFSDYLHEQHILFFQDVSKHEAIHQLAQTVSERVPNSDTDTIIRAVWDRESQLSTRIAPGIAIPHATFPHLNTTYISVGVSHKGILYDAKEDGIVHLIIMLVGDEANHLKALSEMAIRLQIPGIYERIIESESSREIYSLLTSPSPDLLTSMESIHTSRKICRQAVELARSLEATTVIIHGNDTLISGVRCSHQDIRMIYVASDTNEPVEESVKNPKENTQVITMPFRGLNRSSQVEISLLLALSKGLLKREERVVSVFGLNSLKRLDTIVYTDVQNEFKRFFSTSIDNASNDIQQQVFIRVMQLATEIAHEGREGKAVGTLFVIGEYEEVSQHCQQMIANPFKGYEDHERNILDPGLSETIKEFAQIDGAIIIKGNGVIASAGTYLRVKHPIKNFPSGLGARHAAAAGITAATEAVAIAISESTRKLSLFSSGERIMEV